jgi:predicted nucleotidyltransferase
MHMDSVAEALFTSQARLAVLKLLFLNASNRLYLREIATRTCQPVRAVQRELGRLEAGGLLESSLEGRRKYYRVHRQAPIFQDLKSLLIKTVGLGQQLQENLRPAGGRIPLAFIFGSYARRTEAGSNDIDLRVVGSISGRELAKLLAPAAKDLGREINPVILTKEEFREKAAEGNHFPLMILREPKIFLVGGEDELAQLAGAGTSEAT